MDKKLYTAIIPKDQVASEMARNAARKERKERKKAEKPPAEIEAEVVKKKSEVKM